MCLFKCTVFPLSFAFFLYVHFFHMCKCHKYVVNATYKYVVNATYIYVVNATYMWHLLNTLSYIKWILISLLPCG